MSALGDRIHQAAWSLDGGQKELARQIKRTENTISRWVKGHTVPSNGDLQAVAAETGFGLDWLATGIGQPEAAEPPDGDADFMRDFGQGLRRIGAPPVSLGPVPVLGHAAGSLSGALSLSGEALEYKRRPAILEHVADAYALRVTGHSMQDRYRPGDLIFVHPHQPVRLGDIVVIQEQRIPGGDVVAWIKEFVAWHGDRLEARQYSEKPALLTFFRKQVRSVHRVLTNNELFDL